MSQETIKIESLSKNYTDISGYTTQLFENISFDIDANKITTILAPKGSGKSTLLKIISGINEETILSDGKRIYIPTNSSSFPWLNVRENITFNLESIDDINLQNIVKFVGLEGYEDHFPNNNSVGFRFRISLARAIINNPKLILIDESISTLPVKRRLEFYSLLRKVTSEKGIPILFSTSSISEAIRLSDNIVLMNQLPSKVVCEKTILIDEETRVDVNSLFSLSDYFSTEEEKILIKSFI
ncbi:MAG: ATP-binding cassette domain-containing protein [Melioribacteraceae bacterium]|jgi:ABC-type nitrate/sulfonate/bicarbonate transport system ATPase subunit|nr:ATP-binding cassette domain-containing protein [Melioribacteraceae bacterium]